MKRCSVCFESKGKVSLREETVPSLAAGEVAVETEISAISYGTESKVLNGLFPDDSPADTALPALAGSFRFPIKYGYAATGRIVATGKGVDDEWLGKRIFAFNPHESYFISRPDWLVPVPDGVPGDDAALLASMETAVNLVMDGRPTVGERVIVFGQGPIGLLTTAILARFPLATLLTFDHYPLRRKLSLEMGALASLEPGSRDEFKVAREVVGEAGADLAYELSGAPAALGQAIALTGASGRVVAGSWYGETPSNFALGTHFHRSRLTILSSQVSTIDPRYGARWDRSRRFALAWDLVRIIKPSRLITHRFPVTAAPEAYRLLKESPGETAQVVLTYR